MRFIEAKQILSSYSSGTSWFGSNYSINIYKGCSHGCVYCDSRSECYQVENFDEVRAKKDVLTILDKELDSKRRKGIVANGAMSDPYNPCETKYELTKGALELIDKHGFGASILTKSELVVRDIPILKKIQQHSPVVVKFTITTFDDQLSKAIEPHVSVSSRRFAAMQKLTDNGILTGVMLWPILPFITDTPENIEQIVTLAKQARARFVCPSPNYGLTLRQNQRIYYYRELDRLFPGLTEKYVKTFGGNYECSSPYRDQLAAVLERECKTKGLLCRMVDICKLIQSCYPVKQIPLF